MRDRRAAGFKARTTYEERTTPEERQAAHAEQGRKSAATRWARNLGPAIELRPLADYPPMRLNRPDPEACPTCGLKVTGPGWNGCENHS